MAIKHRIKLKSDRGRGTRDATGAPLDLSDNAKASDESSALEGESIGRDVPPDEMNTVRFEEHTDKEYEEHCRKFFKGEVE
tara:strand:- start:162 stop:404 length:243 start_codon:yes stop_codon:yes gene_type:complete